MAIHHLTIPTTLFDVFTFLKDALAGAMRARVPGVDAVETKVTEDGRLVLRFKDGSFKDPFIARHVSDGTIKMFADLLLLHDPKPHPLVAVEEPENQLYPALLTNWWRSSEAMPSAAAKRSCPPTLRSS